MNSIVEDILMHYGMPRRSGRYPYGSGENPYQHAVKTAMTKEFNLKEAAQYIAANPNKKK